MDENKQTTTKRHGAKKKFYRGDKIFMLIQLIQELSKKAISDIKKKKESKIGCIVIK